MEALSAVLPIILYFLLGVLIVVLIVFVFKLIDTMTRVNILLDDVTAKSKSLNGLFETIDKLSETISNANLKLVTGLTKIASKFIGKKKRKNKEKENIENE